MLTAQNTALRCTLLLERLAQAREITDALFDIVRPDALYDRPIAQRHRIIFYVGHLEAFDWNLLRKRLFDLKVFHPDFDQLFAFGIDPVGGGLPTDQPTDWPSLPQVRKYVARIREELDRSLTDLLSAQHANHEDRSQLLLNVAIEHRLMHAETLAYMFHQLPLDRKHGRAASPELVPCPTKPAMIDIPAGNATLGLSRNDSANFGWDNEYEAHTVSVPAFAIDRYKVTNEQFLSFVRSGGYEDRNLWSEADWTWKSDEGISHPVFWVRKDAQWHQRTMFNEIPLPLDWPVYVSHAEASAYARWAGKRLPTEAEWHRAACGTPEGSEQKYPWGSGQPTSRHGNFDFQKWDPDSVGAHPQGTSAFGVASLVGNGWEWTSTQFEPFPGFRAFDFYPGYSANFFDGKHYVMKGASPRTAACMLRRSFRNWFQPHYQYVYAGFRCAQDR
ncbi:MAG TPA: SUMF1/EgtB/PvdO family nonheme iron enzyme [Terriglobales bacterium]|nr:SUMF1/EgtB/PvdO family nonheme iron enzyme [Terriglobales bacterium]